MVAELLEPALDVFKRLCVLLMSQANLHSACAARTVLGDVIHEQRANSATVVGAGDCPVPLLPCCVPYLRLNGLAIDLRCMCTCVMIAGTRTLMLRVANSTPIVDFDS